MSRWKTSLPRIAENRCRFGGRESHHVPMISSHWPKAALNYAVVVWLLGCGLTVFPLHKTTNKLLYHTVSFNWAQIHCCQLSGTQLLSSKKVKLWQTPPNWWLSHPSEKYEFVRLDHHPNYWGKSKSCSKPPTRMIHYTNIPWYTIIWFIIFIIPEMIIPKITYGIIYIYVVYYGIIWEWYLCYSKKYHIYGIPWYNII